MNDFFRRHHSPRLTDPGRPPLVFAHRGASAVQRENTIEAFETARSMGANGVELDVRLTAEGLLAVHHDHDLTDGRVISTLSWTELPAHVPLLDPVLDACGPMAVNVEIKNSRHDPDHDPSEAAAAAVAELVARRDNRADVIVSSFSMATIDRVREIDPDIATAYLTETGADTLDRIVEHGHGAVHPWKATPDAEYMKRARGLGLMVNVWTVDDPKRMLELADLGVDCIVTNVPDRALVVLGRHHE